LFFRIKVQVLPLSGVSQEEAKSGSTLPFASSLVRPLPIIFRIELGSVESVYRPVIPILTDWDSVISGKEYLIKKKNAIPMPMLRNIKALNLEKNAQISLKIYRRFIIKN